MSPSPSRSSPFVSFCPCSTTTERRCESFTYGFTSTFYVVPRKTVARIKGLTNIIPILYTLPKSLLTTVVRNTSTTYIIMVAALVSKLISYVSILLHYNLSVSSPRSVFSYTDRNTRRRQFTYLVMK